MERGQYTYEKTEERMINGKMSTITVRANTPSQTAIKRYAETMTRIVHQIEQRESRG
jgi:hypothetical protein